MTTMQTQFATHIPSEVQLLPPDYDYVATQPATWKGDRDLYRTLLVEPGTKITLGNVDPGYCGQNKSYEGAMPALQSEAEKIDRLQYLMHS